MPSNPYYKFISYLYAKMGDTFTVQEINSKWNTFASRHPELVPKVATKFGQVFLIRSFLDGKVEKGELEKVEKDKYHRVEQSKNGTENGAK